MSYTKKLKKIRSQGIPDQCIDANSEEIGTGIIAYHCHNRGGPQFWLMTKQGEIRKDDYCVDYPGGDQRLGQKDNLLMYQCHGKGGNQKWTMEEDGLLKHASGYCIEISVDGKGLFASKCDSTNQRQIWKWKKRQQS